MISKCQYIPIGIGKLFKTEALVNIDWWWLVLALFGIIYIIRLMLAPYWIYKGIKKNLNDAQDELGKLKVNLADAGFIEVVRFDAIELRDKLKYWKSRGLGIEDHELQCYHEWFNAVSAHLQKRQMNSENTDWYDSVSTGLGAPSIDDVIQAYEAGLNILKDIHKTLTG